MDGKMKKITLLLALLIGLSSHWVSAAEKSKGLECSSVYPLMNAFLSAHLTEKKLNEKLEERAAQQFIKTLDPSKIYFLSEDVEGIKKNFKGLFRKLKQGDCSDIDKAEMLAEKRIEDTAKFVKSVVGDSGFKIDENTTISLDFSKRTHPANKKELEDFLKKYFQFQVANYLVSDMKLPEAKEKLLHRYDLLVKHSKQDPEDVYGNFLDSFASALDPHSNYLSRDTLEDFEINMKLSLEGIGATLSFQDGYTVVESLIPGGAADKSGLIQVKDKIIAVGQGSDGKLEPVIDTPLRDVVKLIRGAKGTTVKLSVLRQGKETVRKEIDLIRDKIDLKDEAAKISYVEKEVGKRKVKLGIINLPSFYADSDRGERSCSDDVKKLIIEGKNNKVDGIVLDLSRNGGGVLGEAVKVAGLFIQRGNVVETRDSSGRVDALADLDSTNHFSGPLVVLTSRLSASASEIVAGALQDYKRAIIIGSDRTFGKGSVQAVMRLRENLGAIKVTTGMFFVPSGDSTQEKGVPSDIKIPSPFVSKEFSEEALDYPLPFKSLPNFTSKEANSLPGEAPFKPVSPKLISELQKKSKERVAKNDDFKKIIKDLKETEEKKGLVKLADVMKKNQDDNKKEKDEANKKKDKDAEYLKQAAVQEATNILLDQIQIDDPSLMVADKSTQVEKRNVQKTKPKNAELSEEVNN